MFTFWSFFYRLSLSYPNFSSFHEFSQILTGGVGRLPNYFEESTDFHGTGGSRSNINAPGGICVMSWYREPAADGRKCHGGWAPGAPQRIQKHSEAPADPAKRTTHHAERMTGAQMRFFSKNRERAEAHALDQKILNGGVRKRKRWKGKEWKKMKNIIWKKTKTLR